jgi:hypothetical protein
MVLLLSFKDDVVGYLTGFGIAVLRSHWEITEPIEKLVGTIMGLLGKIDYIPPQTGHPCTITD